MHEFWPLLILDLKSQLHGYFFFFQIVRDVFKLSCQEAHQTLKLKELRKMTNIKFRMAMHRQSVSKWLYLYRFISESLWKVATLF